MKNIAIFASGGGSNFKAIYNNIVSGYISAKISLVISNNSNSGAIKFAEKNKIPTFVVNKIRFSDIESHDDRILEKLYQYKIHLICLAGYMKMVPRKIIEKYSNSILNIHPSLLPKFGGRGFYGIKVHEAVIKSREKESGVTIHLVDDKYDNGPIVLQEKIKLDDDETAISLSEKILKIEHIVYSEVLKAYSEGKIKLDKIK